MRLFVWMAALFCVCERWTLVAQQPILTHRAAVNAASLAPFGLPNAALARGGVFTVFGESLGPVQAQTVSAFPLGTELAGVSLSVTQADKTVAAIPIFVSANQINAILPSAAQAGLASLRVTFQGRKSNAITIQVGDAGPGIFAISGGGFGPGVVQNFVASDNQPINALRTAAQRGQAITVWATGLGPVTYGDNVAPSVGDLATPVSVTIGGRSAAKLYSGRAPCCSGVDQVVVTVPNDAPLGCWVPLQIKAGAVYSNTVTMAIAEAGASECADQENPLSTLARTAGTQGLIHVQRIDSFDDLNGAPANAVLDKLYARFVTQPAATFAFDPYLSYPAPGSCLVHQTSGDANVNKSLRGAPAVASALTPKPTFTFNNGLSDAKFLGSAAGYSAIALGGTLNGKTVGIQLTTGSAKATVDGVGVPLKLVSAPKWPQRDTLGIIDRGSPLVVTFTPGDASAATAIVLYSYAAQANATVQVQCLAPPGSTTFTIPAATLANLPQTYRILDGSYSKLAIGAVSAAGLTPFSTARVASGALLFSSWLNTSVVLR